MNNIKDVIRRVNVGVVNFDTKIKTLALISTESDTSKQQAIIANMAMMYGHADEKTIIIDIDFGNKALPKAFKVTSEQGLFDYLDNDNYSIDQIINTIQGQNLDMITAGNALSKDIEFLLGDPRFNSLMNVLRKKYMHILFNTPAIEKQNVLESLKHVIDGSILVSLSGVALKHSVRETIHLLKRLDIPVIGYIDAEKGQ